MSFVRKDPKRLKSPEQCAREILDVAVARGLDDFAAVLAVMCVCQESDFWSPWNKADPSSEKYPHDSESNDGRSVSYYQQQNGKAGEALPAGDKDDWWGPMSERMDLKKSTDKFLARLRGDYRQADNNPALASEFISNVQRPRPDLRGAYAKHWDRAWNLINGAKKQEGAVIVPVPGVAARPEFNEIDQIGWDSADPHGSVRSRPPINWFIHTQEGDGNAEQLATFLRNSKGSKAVSYHYTIHEDPNDHGVTVCDVIDTDLYSWSVLNANVFSINACFAGSRAAFTRQQWLDKYRNAIRVAAYLAVEDSKKYSTISANIIYPPYTVKGPGISDHRYVTKALGIGDHTDVGGPLNAPFTGFPWDVLASDVASFLAPLAPTGPAAPHPFEHPPTDVMIREIWDQMRGPEGHGWPQDKNRTPVEHIWEIPTKDELEGF